METDPGTAGLLVGCVSRWVEVRGSAVTGLSSIRAGSPQDQLLDAAPRNDASRLVEANA